MKKDCVVGVTMGHPSGIGPEVTVKAVCSPGCCNRARVAVFGDTGVLERAAKACGLHGRLKELVDQGRVGMVEVSALREREVIPGSPSEAGSLAQVDYVREAVRRASDGAISAIATAPISQAGM
ncbi:MAG: 4-hydroxythreonine-4-phosphate dehydrogenase PdxA, partial [Myxococcota bacterium]